MNYYLKIALLIVLGFVPVSRIHAQESAETAPTETAAEGEGVTEKVEAIADETREKVEDIAEDVNKNKRAQEAAAGVLKPIYQLAEYLSFPAIHWLAFAVMVTGVVSFALQLVLAKLVVLFRFGFSLTEIFSDALGLVISLVGLVLTTQAAAENSSFTSSPFAVLSAALVGVVAGFIFYWWGQKHEIQAVDGRRVHATKAPPPSQKK